MSDSDDLFADEEFYDEKDKMDIDFPDDDGLNLSDYDGTDFIKKCCLEGYPIEKTFYIGCRILKYQILNTNEVNDIIRLSNDKNETWKSNNFYVNLMSKIMNYYELYKKMILYQQEKFDVCDYKESYLNSRYGFKINAEGDLFKKLEVFDYFHGKEKSITITNGIGLKFTQYSSLFPISFEQFLLLNSDTLYLLSLDFKRGKCQVMDKKLIFMINRKIKLNPLNGAEFMIIRSENMRRAGGSNFFVTEGLINDNKIELKERKMFQSPFDFNVELFDSCKFLYLDHKICFLCRNIENKLIGYHEIDLLTNGHNSLKFNFEAKNCLGLKGDWENRCVWTPNKICFVQKSTDNGIDPSIYKFDVSTQTFAQINLNFGSNFNKLIDNNDVLVLKDGNALYRHVLGRPDSLENLTWFKIRKQSIHRNDKLYEKAIKQLPLNSDLQPFSSF